jgi:DNA-binding CsgD family transcriptional regulator
VKKRDSGGKPRSGPQHIGAVSDRHAAAVRHDGVMVDAVPSSDPAYPTVTAILRVVPASRWAFARVAPDGDMNHLLASEGNPDDLSDLKSEFKRQRLEAKSGPRIAAALGPLDEYASGITLLFADARASFGILTLLRTAELGPFTSTEVSMLTFALSAASDQLSALRLQPRESPATRETHGGRSVPAPPEAAFYVLDRDLEIVLAWNSEDQQRIALTGLRTRIADRLPLVLEETVRDLTAAWGIEPNTQDPGLARPVPFLVVRTQPMSGPTGLFIGVRIDRFRPPNSLTRAASRFHISPRELQVLALLLDGAHLDEIGRRLNITSSTVQDHIRSMVEKTDSRNRTELVARVLGWESSLGEPPA